MKILAIRGKNLASLSAEFCLDFRAEPLASAGLFGITGPTGSGKSTLLDALCLALYEKTPRLARAGARGEVIPDVGENSVGPSDPRTLLRRGAVEGYAEVDFVGSDGISYRAHWSVRRARNKSDGKLQNSEVSLIRLSDEQVLGDHRKTETYKLIESLIGLNFEQFTRAVLLAQNDFAAFLKASDDERAELLQTLTGTETFTQISRQAYARAKEEKDKQALLVQALADQAPMAAEAREARNADLLAQDKAVVAFEQQKGLLEGHLRWHGEWQKQKAEEEAVAGRLKQAETTWNEVQPRRAGLARIESVQAARPLRDEVLRLEQEIGKDESALKAAQSRATQAMGVAAEKKQQLATARLQAEAAEKARTEAQPPINQAKELDAHIQALTPGFQAALKASADAAKALEAEEGRRKKLEQEHGQVEKARREAELWHAANPQLRPLAEGWQRWHLLLAQASGHLAQQKLAVAEIGRFKKREQGLQGQIAKASAEYQRCTAAHTAAADALAQAAQACARFDGEAMAQRRKSLEARRDQLAESAQVWQSLSEQDLRRQGLIQQEQSLSASLDNLAAELRQLAESRPMAEQAGAGAERSLRLAELAASESVEALRAGLEAEAPCPVCGATSHPYAEQNPVAEGMLSALRAEVERCRKALADIGEKSAKAAGRQQEAEKQKSESRKESAILDSAVEATLRQWQGHPLKEEFIPVSEAQRQAWFTERRAEAKAALEDLARQEAAQRQALQGRDAAQGAATQARTAMETARIEAERLGWEQGSTAQDRQAAEDKHLGVAQQLASALTDLDAAFTGPSWREDWQAQPEAFASASLTQVESWNRCQQQLSQLAQRSGQFETEIKALDAAWETAARYQREQAEHCRLREEELQGRRQARAILFQGKPVAEVEAALAAAIVQAADILAKCGWASQEAEGENLRLDEARKQASHRLEQTLASLTSARQVLADWLGAFAAVGHTPLAAEELASLLAFTPDWIRVERDALQALAGAIESTRAVLRENARRREEHEGQRPTAESVESVGESLAKFMSDMAPAKEKQAELRLELARDDEKRQNSKALMARIGKQADIARVWSQLNDLIGSADGKKFRNFAQQLTLDILLGYANRHLETLSRRYRLERIKDSLGLLVVDQDMGDEVRSVHSLSGGESFLVSLALALGLASLSSHRVKVGSLFIDEGFGSLDADSLGVAMEALDKLQAQGRKVGVISHVQEMNERLGTRIQVSRLAGGKSAVTVEG
jgi:exonuclease SbcC